MDNARSKRLHGRSGKQFRGLDNRYHSTVLSIFSFAMIAYLRNCGQVFLLVRPGSLGEVYGSYPSMALLPGLNLQESVRCDTPRSKKEILAPVSSRSASWSLVVDCYRPGVTFSIVDGVTMEGKVRVWTALKPLKNSKNSTTMFHTDDEVMFGGLEKKYEQYKNKLQYKENIISEFSSSSFPSGSCLMSMTTKLNCLLKVVTVVKSSCRVTTTSAW